MSQFSLADIYEKVTKDIIRYVIRKLPGRVHLARGTRGDKLPNMSLDPNLKQDKKLDGTSAVEKYEYKLQVLEWKENTKIQTKRKMHVNKGNHNLYAILIDQSSSAMCSKPEGSLISLA